MTAAVEKKAFGTLPDGRAVTQYVLRAGPGVLRVLDLGGIVAGFEAPDRAGRVADVVLGLARLEDYLADTCYHGALVGRFCNRIAGGRFTLDGREYKLAVNNGPNHIHGGLKGFNRALWRAEPFTRGDACGLVLRHSSPDGDEGYPGRLDVEAVYTLSPPATWRVEIRATTSAPTVLNLTQHAYFNLAGHDEGGFEDQTLQIHATRFLPKDATGIPTGERRAIAGGAFDFCAPRAMREPAGPRDPQLYGDGYDHCWMPEGTGLRAAAEAFDPASGRTLAVRTTQPGLHFYNGFYNDTSPAVGKHGRRYGSKSGFALEAQHFPDSPNQPAFPSAVLRPGETFHEVTEFQMGVRP
jgi:aldose 1-epimerase